MISQKMKARRLRSGMSQQDLADRIGVHRVAVCQWESGRRVPTLRSAVRIAAGLGCSVNDLVTQ